VLISEMDNKKRQGVRVSLGYRDLVEIDPELVASIGRRVTWLDLTGNRFSDDLLMLRSFPSIEVLVLDNNNITTHIQLPPLRNLHTLWLNCNNIDNTTVLLDHLVQVTPNLEELSLLKNPACVNYFTGGTPKDYRDYRLYVINRLTNLCTLDGIPVTPEEYEDSTRMYGSLVHTRAAKKESQNVNSSAQTFQNSVDYTTIKEPSVIPKELDLPKLKPENSPTKNTSTNNTTDNTTFQKKRP